VPRLLVALACLGILAAPRSTAAQSQAKPLGMQRVVLDRVDATPSPLHDLVRLRLFVTTVDLNAQGNVIPIEAGATPFTIGGSASAKRVPYTLGLFAASDVETAIAVVVQTTGYDAELDGLKDAIAEELLGPLEGMARTQVVVIGYADQVTAKKLVSPKQAIAHLGDLTATEATEFPDLTRAVDRAVKLLRKAKPTVEGANPAAMRKLVVVVSDGRTAEDDRAAITRIGKQADKLGIRIHTIGFSPAQRRRPLLALGELSKTSQGTFRWIRENVGATSLRTPFQRLLDEIRKQYVLTMFVPATELPSKLSVEVSAAGKTLKSRDLKVPEPLCGEADDPCKADQYCAANRCVSRRREEGRGFFGYLMWIVGGVIGLLGIVVGAGFVITKLGSRPKRPPPPIVQLPGQAPPIAAPVTASHQAVGPKLYVISGRLAGQRLALKNGFTIGKEPDCDLSLPDDGFASGHHAQILVDAAGFCQLIDQGSTNGTYINGVRITEPMRLFDGMSIRCGSTELRFLQT
jgi:hypothetical protein